jgi:hypothetical protein
MVKRTSIQVRASAVTLTLLAATVSGCRAIGFVFKAGAWTATIGILVLAALVFGVVQMFRRGA